MKKSMNIKDHIKSTDWNLYINPKRIESFEIKRFILFTQVTAKNGKKYDWTIGTTATSECNDCDELKKMKEHQAIWELQEYFDNCLNGYVGIKGYRGRFKIVSVEFLGGRERKG